MLPRKNTHPILSKTMAQTSRKTCFSKPMLIDYISMKCEFGDNCALKPSPASRNKQKAPN